MLGEAGWGMDLGFQLGPVSSSQCKRLNCAVAKEAIWTPAKRDLRSLCPSFRSPHLQWFPPGLAEPRCFLGSMEGLAQLDEALKPSSFAFWWSAASG